MHYVKSNQTLSAFTLSIAALRLASSAFDREVCKILPFGGCNYSTTLSIVVRLLANPTTVRLLIIFLLESLLLYCCLSDRKCEKLNQDQSYPG